MWEEPAGGHSDLMCQGNHSQLWRRGSYCIGARWGWGIGWDEACMGVADPVLSAISRDPPALPFSHSHLLPDD